MNLKIYNNVSNVKSQESNVGQTIPSYKVIVEETCISRTFLIFTLNFKN